MRHKAAMINVSDLGAIDLAGVEWIWLDLFDTVVLRRAPPEQVKGIAAAHCAAAFGLHWSTDQLYRRRRAIEDTLYAEAAARGHDPEIDFHTLAARLFAEAARHAEARFGLDEARFISKLLQIEKAAEASVTSVDPVVVSWVREQRQRGRRTACLSDFYLPEDQVAELLDGLGIADLFDHLFVSSSRRVTKRSGRLYEAALNELGCDRRAVLMIGDNPETDFAPAVARGLRAVLVDRRDRRRSDRRFVLRQKHLRLLQGHLAAELRRRDRETPVPGVHFGSLGFALYIFAQELHHRLLANRAGDAFFLAKEGQFLKRLFDLYQDRLALREDLRVRSHYFLASRRATFIPSLRPLADESFQTLFRQYANNSLDNFLASLGLGSDIERPIMQDLGVVPDQRYEQLPTRPEFAELLRHPTFCRVFEERRVRQRELFLDYLESFGVDFRRDGLHLVDVGWKGTTQDNVARILAGTTRVVGYYLGLISGGDTSSHSPKHALVFDRRPPPSTGSEVFGSNRALYEILLDAPHGSAREYLPREAGYVALEEHAEERALYDRVVAPFQTHLLDIFGWLCDELGPRQLDRERLLATLAPLQARLAFLPTPAETDLFRRFHHRDNFGLFGETRFDAVPPPGVLRSGVNLLRLALHSDRVLHETWWAPIILEDLGLGSLRRLYGAYKTAITLMRVRP